MEISPQTQSKLSAIFGFSSNQTIRETYLVARQALSVDGCFVECGVASGGGCAPMALALIEVGDRRKIHLFDSFEGLPHCGPKDMGQMGHEPGNYLMDPNLPEEERLKTTNLSVGSVEQVTNNMKMWGVQDANFEYHKGWFQHTLPGLQLAPIAFLRLDGDLYESTMCCLTQLVRSSRAGRLRVAGRVGNAGRSRRPPGHARLLQSTRRGHSGHARCHGHWRWILAQVNIRWTKPTGSGLCDRIYDLLFLAAYARLKDSRIITAWEPFDFQPIDVDHRRMDILLHNVQAHINFPHEIVFSKEQRARA
jgi:hypothetical protein